jgi:flavodoxin
MIKCRRYNDQIQRPCKQEDDMKIAVIYFTKTGHSRKIADAVAAGLKIKAEDINNGPKLKNVDLLFVVGGIYGSSSDPKMVGYIKDLDGGMVKKAVLITSCASNRIKQTAVREALTKNGIDVLPDEYLCKGNFLFMRLGHPNKADIENAVSFAKKVVSSAGKTI